MENQLQKVELKNLLNHKIKQKESFKNFGFEDRNLFSEVWNSIAFRLGIREALIEPELIIIFEFLQVHFKTVSLNDLRSAFDLYSAQKLQFKDSHYQSLDNVFIGKVLTSYREYVSVQLRNNPKKIEVKKIPQLTFDQVKFEAEESFKNYKEGGDLENFNYDQIYNYYKNEGLIKFEGNQAKEFQERVKDELRAEVKIEKQKGKSGANKLLSIQLKSLFYWECKKRAVLNYYEFTTLFEE